ncbi:MAG: type III-B CRISPR module RAMP protein Cmr1 [Hydrogenibacillus schlegelii]|uniref:Type III-B CRISPR module RAMP protein Cmr1 n=1 Tax=Hydrogenibacillus schlegelii TaxID=1484 RepID=A0A947CZ11_HYDSH|nr:type III-B CRISPR module RAMP protein Cmr1 [Hydrogenibacillus schlegelii]
MNGKGNRERLRKARQASPPPVRFDPASLEELVFERRVYEVITPMFGGVVPRSPDPITPVRGTAIRGQLRFWWRAVRGGKSNGDLARLYELEAEIWGMAAGGGAKAGASRTAAAESEAAYAVSAEAGFAEAAAAYAGAAGAAPDEAGNADAGTAEAAAAEATAETAAEAAAAYPGAGKARADGQKPHRSMNVQIFVRMLTPHDPLRYETPYPQVNREEQRERNGRNDRDLRQEPDPLWKKVAYVAFPLQSTRGEPRLPPGRVIRGVKFALELIYPKRHQEDVHAALWAWETFGGLGARTRRGFGAIRLVEIDGRRIPPPATVDDVRRDIEKKLKQYVGVDGKWPPGVPHLHPHMRLKVIGPSGPRAGRSGDDGRFRSAQTCFRSVEDAWTELVSKLRAFRKQQVNGRSAWPEADAIRNLLRAPGRRGRPQNEPKGEIIDKFPRAAFGLPIVFHFKGGKSDPREKNIELRGRLLGDGNSVDRLASPLILRPYACQNGAVGLALILENTGIFQWRGHRLALQAGRRTYAVDPFLTPKEAQKISPLQPLPLRTVDGKVDVLAAFFETL